MVEYGQTERGSVPCRGISKYKGPVVGEEVSFKEVKDNHGSWHGELREVR